MNILERAGQCSIRLSRQIVASFLLLAVLFAIWPQSLRAYQDAQAPAQPAAPQPPYTQQAPEQLQQLVAPIALYPDSLVSQILAASTFPEQVVEADRWVQAHPDLKRQRFRSSGRPATLGPERQGTHGISIRTWKYG